MGRPLNGKKVSIESIAGSGKGSGGGFSPEPPGKPRAETRAPAGARGRSGRALREEDEE